MRPESVGDMLEAVCDVVRQAGTLIQSIRAQGLDPTQKSDDSPVTRADREADAALKSGLLELLPAGWLSEETADDETRLQQRRLWVVDPLDGTKEFVKGLAEYTIAVALVEEGEPVLGVVHNPATGALWSAVRGEGAHDAAGEPLRVREGDRMLTSRSETARGEFEPFEGAWELEPMGSIELKLARVAAGGAALTLSRGPKHEWDVCAGALLVSEAGGRATDIFGGPLRFNRAFPKVKGILAGAPDAYARALARISEIGASDRMEEFVDLQS